MLSKARKILPKLFYCINEIVLIIHFLQMGIYIDYKVFIIDVITSIIIEYLLNFYKKMNIIIIEDINMIQKHFFRVVTVNDQIKRLYTCEITVNVIHL